MRIHVIPPPEGNKAFVVIRFMLALTPTNNLCTLVGKCMRKKTMLCVSDLVSKFPGKRGWLFQPF